MALLEKNSPKFTIQTYQYIFYKFEPTPYLTIDSLKLLCYTCYLCINFMIEII